MIKPIAVNITSNWGADFDSKKMYLHEFRKDGHGDA